MTSLLHTNFICCFVAVQDDEQGSEAPMSACDHNVQGCSSQDMQIFFRLVEFSSDVPIRLDYQGKHDMDMGQVSFVLFKFYNSFASELSISKYFNLSFER